MNPIRGVAHQSLTTLQLAQRVAVWSRSCEAFPGVCVQSWDEWKKLKCLESRLWDLDNSMLVELKSCLFMLYNASLFVWCLLETSLAADPPAIKHGWPRHIHFEEEQDYHNAKTWIEVEAWLKLLWSAVEAKFGSTTWAPPKLILDAD